MSLFIHWRCILALKLYLRALSVYHYFNIFPLIIIMKLKGLSREQLNALIVYMRYRNRTDQGFKYAFMTYQCISQIVKRSAGYCRDACLKHVEGHNEADIRKPIVTRKSQIQNDNAPERRTKLKDIHYEFLVDQGTLDLQVGKSLEERAADFMRVFPSKRMSSTRLHRIYRDHKVRKKKVRITKILNRKLRRNLKKRIPEVQQEIREHQRRGFRILYLDEMMITTRTMPTHEWSRKNTNIAISYHQFQQKAISGIAAISWQRGVDYVILFKKSVNRDKFKIFLQGVRDKFPFDDIALYMDNLSVHKSKEITERMDELGFAYIFGPAYSPDFNPVETIFSIAKSYVKKRRLAAVINGYDLDLWQTIRDSFD